MQKTQEQLSVTSLVMSNFSVLPGAPRACADFCDPTVVFRFKRLRRIRCKATAVKIALSVYNPNLFHQPEEQGELHGGIQM
ncbi:MAG: hypothetical protein ACWA44_15425 [Thiotrichales bacterium]